MIRSLRRFILFDVAGIDPLLFFELQGWTEIVVEKAPFVYVEVVDQGDEIRIVETVVAKQLANMGPVFLFYERIVVLSVWT